MDSFCPFCQGTPTLCGPHPLGWVLVCAVLCAVLHRQVLKVLGDNDCGGVGRGLLKREPHLVGTSLLAKHSSFPVAGQGGGGRKHVDGPLPVFSGTGWSTGSAGLPTRAASPMAQRSFARWWTITRRWPPSAISPTWSCSPWPGSLTCCFCDTLPLPNPSSLFWVGCFRCRGGS